MRKVIILFTLSIISLNTFAQLEAPGGPGGVLDVDIYAVKKEGFTSMYMGQGIIALDIIILARGYDLRNTEKFETTVRPIEIAISAPGKFSANFYAYTIPKINNFLNTYFDKKVRHLNTNFYFYRIKVPIIKLTGVDDIATNNLTITVDPKGFYTKEYLEKITHNNYLGYFFEAPDNRRNNVVSIPMANKITILNPMPPVLTTN